MKALSYLNSELEGRCNRTQFNITVWLFSFIVSLIANGLNYVFPLILPSPWSQFLASCSIIVVPLLFHIWFVVPTIVRRGHDLGYRGAITLSLAYAPIIIVTIGTIILIGIIIIGIAMGMFIFNEISLKIFTVVTKFYSYFLIVIIAIHFLTLIFLTFAGGNNKENDFGLPPQ